MSAKHRLKLELKRAASLSLGGEFNRAREILDAIRENPESRALGHRTSAGLPRQLQSAYLKLSKAESNSISRVGYQFHLVPPPDTLATYAHFSSAERGAIAAANRQSVPRTLHQIWIGDAPLPEGTAAWRQHAEQHGYHYRLWREDDLSGLGITENRIYQAMLARGDFPGAVDVARYFILKQWGGIYLDCDWYPARSDISFHDLLPLLGLSVMAEPIPRNTGKGALLLANSLLATPAEHPVFSRLLDALEDVMLVLPEAPAWWTTGPLVFTLMARGGSLTLADAGIVAGSLPQETSHESVTAWCRENQENDGGLLLAWKSWIW